MVIMRGNVGEGWERIKKRNRKWEGRRIKYYEKAIKREGYAKVRKYVKKEQ